MAEKRKSIIYLEPIEHKYYHKVTGETFKSVTTVLSMLEPEFNKEEICEHFALGVFHSPLLQIKGK